jgi:ABC-type dipeptide/oligopeptide/nickel transport system permease component
VRQIRAPDHRLGADKPVPVQYAKFFWRIHPRVA